MIRPAQAEDLPKLQDIERNAGRLFATVGMEEIADDDPPSLAELREYYQEDRAWVWAGDGDEPAAYILVDIIDGHPHIEQVTVDPAHSRKGIGKQLIDHVTDWAISRGASTLTLTTFSKVPWNAPYYRRLGFHTMPSDQLSPGLREVRARESEQGLDQWPREVMFKSLKSA